MLNKYGPPWITESSWQLSHAKWECILLLSFFPFRPPFLSLSLVLICQCRFELVECIASLCGHLCDIVQNHQTRCAVLALFIYLLQSCVIFVVELIIRLSCWYFMIRSCYQHRRLRCIRDILLNIVKPGDIGQKLWYELYARSLINSALG